jgi:hypothetical protein
MNEDEQVDQRMFSLIAPYIRQRQAGDSPKVEIKGVTSMSVRNSFAKTALMAAAGMMAFTAVATAPTFAAAQSAAGRYDSQSGTYYDPCQRDQTNRATFGGILGALAGAAIGKSSAACDSQGAPRSAYNSGGSQPYYSQGAYRHRDYDDRDEQVTVVEEAPPPSADRCTLAESPIYLPDGRVQKRFVRVCQDSSGRYQVVD